MLLNTEKICRTRLRTLSRMDSEYRPRFSRKNESVLCKDFLNIMHVVGTLNNLFPERCLTLKNAKF